MPTVRTGDLIDSAEVASILGLRHRNSVITYSRRYLDFPRPVVVTGRIRLWLRSEIQGWAPNTLNPGTAASSERVRAQLLAAAAALMAERPISDISIREIASAAGVAHTLIYRYFGSKAELERAVVHQAIAEVTQVIGTVPEGGQASIERLIAELEERRSSLRVLIQALGTPEGAQEFGASAPVLEAMMTSLRARTSGDRVTTSSRLAPFSLRPEVAVGAVGALIVGWVAFQPRINAATGLTGIPTVELAMLCAELLERGAVHKASEA